MKIDFYLLKCILAIQHLKRYDYFVFPGIKKKKRKKDKETQEAQGPSVATELVEEPVSSEKKKKKKKSKSDD